MSPSHPDFELYDNVGRTTEQIHAYNTGLPTSDDLRRWAAHDAQEFTNSITAGDAGQSTTAWTDHLHRARTTAQFQTVANAVLGDGPSALGALHQFLETAADWCEHHEEANIAHRYRTSAQRLAELGDQLAYLGEAHSPTPTNAPRPTATKPFLPHRLRDRRHRAAPPAELPTTERRPILATRSFIARPTETGFTGIYVHWDGYPSHQLPLLLAAYQHRFAGDIDALCKHLIDDVAVGWSVLGTDLLDGTPPALRTELAGDTNDPSDELDGLVRADGSPPKRISVDERSAGRLNWGYVLHPHGIEVISLYEERRGPLVGWETDPRTRFSDQPRLWSPARPRPATTPPRTTQPSSAPAKPAPAPGLRR